MTWNRQTFNAVHGALRCLGERANSLLKTASKALRHYRLPLAPGPHPAAALVLLHHENTIGIPRAEPGRQARQSRSV